MGKILKSGGAEQIFRGNRLLAALFSLFLLVAAANNVNRLKKAGDKFPTSKASGRKKAR